MSNLKADSSIASVAAVDAANTGGGEGIKGASSGGKGTGVHGVSDAGFGVLDESTSGRGVVATSREEPSPHIVQHAEGKPQTISLTGL